MAAAAVLSLGMVFVQFTGSTGVRNTPRLYVFIPVCVVLAVPLVWWWAGSRGLEIRSEKVKMMASAAGCAAVLGGIIMFGSEWTAGQKPVYSNFLNDQDAKMYETYWNQLAPGSLVFDPEPSRSATIFGRPSNAAYTWYAYKPEWEQLRSAPEPGALRAAGYSYVYLDNLYWDGIGAHFQESLQAACVKTLSELKDDYGFRRLLDIRSCQ